MPDSLCSDSTLPNKVRLRKSKPNLVKWQTKISDNNQCQRPYRLVLYEWSVCKLQQRGQNIPSNNRGNCRSSTSWRVPEVPLWAQCSNWSRIGDQAHREHYVCLQRWLAGYPQATPGACSQMVPPLSTAPLTHTSRRDNECCNELERYVYHHPVINKVLQILPDW